MKGTEERSARKRENRKSYRSGMFQEGWSGQVYEGFFPVFLLRPVVSQQSCPQKMFSTHIYPSRITWDCLLSQRDAYLLSLCGQEFDLAQLMLQRPVEGLCGINQWTNHFLMLSTSFLLIFFSKHFQIRFPVPRHYPTARNTFPFFWKSPGQRDAGAGSYRSWEETEGALPTPPSSCRQSGNIYTMKISKMPECHCWGQ